MSRRPYPIILGGGNLSIETEEKKED